MEIIENKALKLLLRNPSRVTEVIPKSKVVGTKGDVSEVLVHWGFDECIVLKNLGIKNVPSPINKDYAWHGLYKPFSHQKETAAFLTLHKRAYCLNEMGTGKTVSVLWAADYLMTKGYIRRVLIVCPLSIMHSAWKADAFKSVMHRTVDVAHGSREKRTEIIKGSADIVVINYDGIEIVADAISKSKFDLIVIDEYNHYKNSNSKRWKVMNSLVKPNTWLWGLTGSPASQSPTDAYGLAKLMNPSSVPPFFGGFRDDVMYKVTQYKYIPRPNAMEIVYKVLQPAVRFTKAECLDLPERTYITREVPLSAQQKKYYKQLKEQMLIEAAGEEISTANAAINLNKLMQIACIEYNTPVLTDSGWKPIQTVTASDFIWDGIDWVNSQGAIFRGIKPIEKCFGVGMTLDHKVLTTQGWVIAEDILNGKSCNKFSRASVRLPNSNSKKWYLFREIKKSSMVMSMRLRKPSHKRKPIFTNKTASDNEKLWMSSWKRNTQNDKTPSVFKLSQHGIPLPQPQGQRLQKLRRTRDCCMPRMVTGLRELLGRYGGFLRRRVDIRSNRRQWDILQGELQVGYSKGAIKQHEIQYPNRYPQRENDCRASCGGLRDKIRNSAQEIEVWVACGSSSYATPRQIKKTYDLINCGPRNRFVVLGDEGPLIVHNCGAVYSDNKEVIEFDCNNRLTALEEIVEEASKKVIVFATFKHSIAVLQDYLSKKGYSTDVIHGGVPLNRRSEIFNNFQTKPDPHILIIQPRSASHGVTLTAANVVVWWSPTPSVETYIQANDRVHRAGQDTPCTVVHLCGSPVEERFYKALEQKGNLLDGLLDLYKDVLQA